MLMIKHDDFLFEYFCSFFESSWNNQTMFIILDLINFEVIKVTETLSTSQKYYIIRH